MNFLLLQDQTGKAFPLRNKENKMSNEISKHSQEERTCSTTTINSRQPNEQKEIFSLIIQFILISRY